MRRVARIRYQDRPVTVLSGPCCCTRSVIDDHETFPSLQPSKTMDSETYYVKGFSVNTRVLQQQIEVDDDDQNRNRKIDEASVQMSLYLREHGVKHVRCSGKRTDAFDPQDSQIMTVLSVGEEACGRSLQAVRQAPIHFPRIFLEMKDISLLSGPFVFETNRETLVLEPISKLAYSYFPPVLPQDNLKT
ncbi:hypothetical protein D9757_009419 [Collybiopsis confluens]|uniref:Uncharacterized protein n=1 Tax=Collybiopsis confluens TaxID=2823264 RepID=A0A8H5HDB9_9AGAR|nr:hypothetical protein D9757_009419 [Collybiopsis confluens]